MVRISKVMVTAVPPVIMDAVAAPIAKPAAPSSEQQMCKTIYLISINSFETFMT